MRRVVAAAWAGEAVGFRVSEFPHRSGLGILGRPQNGDSVLAAVFFAGATD